MRLKRIIKNIFNCCFHSPAKDVAAKDCFYGSISVEVDWPADYDCSGLANRTEVDWPSLFDIVNQKGRRAFFVPLDKIQPKKDLCENCINLMFDNDIDFTERGWFCFYNKWDNRGELESPVRLPYGKGLHSSCSFFSAVLREDI